MMEREVFSTKETGDFVNSRFIFKKYLLNKDKSDDIQKRYGIVLYPTFLILNTDGTEVTRNAGFSRTTKEFIDTITEVTKKENCWAARNERYKNDPSYSIEHLNYLQTQRMYKQANSLLPELFKSRKVKENFNKESVAYYSKYINNVKDPIIIYMLENKGAVSKVMGSDNFDNFMCTLANSYISSRISYSLKSHINMLKLITPHKEFHTAYYKYIIEARDIFYSDDVAALLKLTKERVANVGASDKISMLTTIAHKVLTVDNVDSDIKKEVEKILKDAYSVETNENYKRTYRNLANRIR